MKNKLFKFGTFLVVLMGLASNKIYSSKKTDLQETQYINNVNENTPLYLDETLDNNGITKHNSHSAHHSHYSHKSHYSSKF